VHSVQLGDVADIERNGIDPSNIVDGTLYVGLEHIEAGGRLRGVKSVTNGDLASTKFVFGPNHVLYGKLRPYLAKITAPDFHGICSTDILPILPGPNLDRSYLTHFLRQPSMIDYAASRAEGANLPRLSPKALAKFEIPLVPLDEQRRIAAILDKVDQIRQTRKKAIALLDSLTQSIFLEMFGDPVSNPMGWDESFVLSDVAEIGSGVTKGRPLRGKSTRSVPYLAVANVQDRALKLDVVKEIEATEDEIARYRLLKSDLLMTEGGDPDKLGRGTLWNEELPEAIHQNHIFRVRFKDRCINPLFANWQIGSQRGKSYFLLSAKQTTGIASINKTQLAKFPLFLPPHELQLEFERRAAIVVAKRAISEIHMKETNSLFASLQHRAFSGQL
jgi:type I restriction enzyme S subunit